MDLKFNRRQRIFSIALVVSFLLCYSKLVLAEFSIDEVAPGVYVHFGSHEQISYKNKGDISNIGFIVGEKAVAVIDTGGSRFVGEQLRELISQVTEQPIRYVILTHAHPDHVFGVKAFFDTASDVDMVGHKNLSNSLIQRAQFYRQRFINEQGFAKEDLQLVPQTIFVDQSLSLDLGDRKITLDAFETSHTDNDLTVFDETTRTIWTGDLLFRRRVPVIDGNVRGWLKSMDSISNKKVSRIIPGHGPVAENWQDAMTDQQRYLERVISDVKEKLDQGAVIQDAVETAAQDEKQNWLLFDDHHGQNVSRTFSELEWE